MVSKIQIRLIFVKNRLLGALFLMSLFMSCENDLEKVKQISAKKLKVPVERTIGVEIIYSDSARVKAKLKTPLLLHYKTQKPYFEMPKGIIVDFFDEKLKPTSKVISDYAIRRENEKLVELRKNVVATNVKGDTFKSDELIWDENKKRFFSNKQVTINTSGRFITGTSFWSNEDFTYYEIDQGTGTFDVKDDLSAQ